MNSPGDGLGIFTDREYFSVALEFGKSVFCGGGVLVIGTVYFSGLSNKGCLSKYFIFSTVFSGSSSTHQILQ